MTERSASGESGVRVGVDVGGTNTDAVLMAGRDLLAASKTPTTRDVGSGIRTAIAQILDQADVSSAEVQCVMIGTTHFVNATIQRKGLLPVGIVRVALPAAKGIPPLTDWPADLMRAVGGHVYSVRGGYQYDGSINAALDEKAVADAARDIKRKGLKAAAVTALFSPVNSYLEERVFSILRNEVPDLAVTLSSSIGRIGLLDRENAAIINASLTELSHQVVQSFGEALEALNIDAPFLISQNDGTLMSADYVKRYPVLTFAAGSTNSMRGAAYLTGQETALVADIGGTTTDVGVLNGGFPRDAALNVDIGGVRSNFRMPDVLSVGLGGGSLIHQAKGEVSVGPDSVGYELEKKAHVFGGSTLTASDIAVAAGYAEMGDADRVRSLDRSMVDRAVGCIHDKLIEAVDRMKTSAEALPLVLVGGGAVLIDRNIPGTSEVRRPDHARSANAIGASIAQVSGEVDRVYSYDDLGRDGAIAMAREDAIAAAEEAGAKRGTVEVVDIEETALAYVPGTAVRLRIRAAGALDLERTAMAERMRRRGNSTARAEGG